MAENEKELEDLEPENGDDIKGGDVVYNTAKRARKVTKDFLEDRGVHVEQL